ncbi:hypothetical protein [Spirosoma fluminis]
MADQDPKDKEILELKTKLQTAETENVKLQKEAQQKDTDLATANTVITELKQQLEKQQGAVQKHPQLTIGKLSYELISEFMWAGKLVTLNRLKEDAKLAKELVDEGVANLRLVEKA